ncbi:protein mab-21-like 3 [Liolophura sinensis]|uniref:protein mab-21-like 3 n=1 Tax=Liolophura sinensis TaxID=3198878 RepID=UPI003158A6FF
MYSNNNTSCDLNRLLNVYFEKAVKIRSDENDQVIQVVHETVDNILKAVNKADPRFARPNEAKYVGSYYQGLKVKRPDEFDITVPMTQIPNPVWTSHRRRYYGFNRTVPESQTTVPNDLTVVRKDFPLPLPPPGQMFLSLRNDHRTSRQHKDLMFDDDLIPFLVRRMFKRLVTDAIKDLGLVEKVRISKFVHGPAITLKINTSDLPFEVRVDLAPMCNAKLPFISWTDWPRRERRWPPEEKIKAIKATEISAVAKKDFNWTLSFSECERELIMKIDTNEGVRTKCHMIMKSLREEFWCPYGMKQVMTSYDLKNLLFWECERNPLDGDWTSDKLAERFLGMTHQLLVHLRQRHLSMYFYPDVKLFKEEDAEYLDEVARRVEDFLTDPSLQLCSNH